MSNDCSDKASGGGGGGGGDNDDVLDGASAIVDASQEEAEGKPVPWGPEPVLINRKQVDSFAHMVPYAPLDCARVGRCFVRDLRGGDQCVGAAQCGLHSGEPRTRNRCDAMMRRMLCTDWGLAARGGSAALDTLLWYHIGHTHACYRMQVCTHAVATAVAVAAACNCMSVRMLPSDDDIDIAIIDPLGGGNDGPYERVAANLATLLGEDFTYQIRPWEGGDKVRLKRIPSIFLDLFCLRRFDDIQQITDLVLPCVRACMHSPRWPCTCALVHAHAHDARQIGVKKRRSAERCKKKWRGRSA